MSDIIKVDFGTGQVVERETVTVPEPVQERLDRKAARRRAFDATRHGARPTDALTQLERDRARTVAEVLGLEKPR